MLIRRLEPGDLDDLLTLYTHLHEDDDPLPESAVVESVWRELMDGPWHQILGGFASGLLVASCALTVIPNLTRGCRPFGLIENVVTHAGHRRRGYGRLVLQEALKVAWSANCYKVMLLTGRPDEATLRFYESAGFDRQGKQGFVARPTG